MNDKTYPPYKFRKKPVVIEAWRIVPNSPQPSWVREAFAKSEGVTGAIDWDAAGEGMWINTLEGCMTANEGDWLIKGIKGELYACKPDIFEATYEAVDVDADREARGVPQGWKLVPVEATRDMMAAAVIYANGNAVYKNVPAAALEIEESIYGEVYAAMIANTPPALATRPTEAQGEDAAPYGIIDPDYARVFTMARVLAWNEGYALAMHGSFTRDLDLLAVPWTDKACEPEHLVRRLEEAAGLTNISGDKPGEKPHGRRAWTLVFKKFADPRFIDLSIMPRAATPPQPTSKTGGA